VTGFSQQALALVVQGLSGSLEDWLRPEGMTYQGLLFPRPATWPAYQKLIMMDGHG